VITDNTAYRLEIAKWRDAAIQGSRPGLIVRRDQFRKGLAQHVFHRPNTGLTLTGSVNATPYKVVPVAIIPAGRCGYYVRHDQNRVTSKRPSRASLLRLRTPGRAAALTRRRFAHRRRPNLRRRRITPDIEARPTASPCARALG
jgi:hypothetical protein